MVKISELRKYKQGSQKWHKHPTATDDKKKYIGKWEEYTEPQGVNSKANRRNTPKDAPKTEAELREFGASTHGDYPIRFAPAATTITADAEYPTDEKQIKKSRRAPKRKVRRSVKAMSGPLKPKTDPYRIYETIRRPIFCDLNGEYEVMDGETLVGRAKVDDNVVTFLDVREDAVEAYPGQVYNALIGTIVREADYVNANLSIEVIPSQMHDMKNFLERFGFRHVGDNIMRRNAGAAPPPSVPLTRGMGGKG